MAIVVGDPTPAGEVKAGEEKVTFATSPVLLDGEEIGRIIQMGNHLFNWAANEAATKRGLKLMGLSGWTRESIIDTVDSMVERQLRRLNAGQSFYYGDDNPLDPELQGWVDKQDFGDCLRHPLVFAVPYTEQLAPTYNARLKLLRREADEALADRNFEKYIWLHERAYRLHAFLTVMGSHELPDKDYWEFVAKFWTDSENIRQNFRDWLRLWSSKRAGREHVMDEDEQQKLAELPETITVYRGYRYKASMRGLSWTLDRDRAVWFARRFDDALTKLPPRVATAEVRRENVLAYLDRRDEDEVVVLPKNLLNLRTEIVPARSKA